MARGSGLPSRRRLWLPAAGRGTERIAIIGQALPRDLALLVGKQRMPLLVEDERLNRQIKAVALPESDVPVGNIRRVKQNASGLEPTTVVEHLKEPRRVVVAFAQRAPIHGHHGGIKPPFEISQGCAHLFLTSG